MSKKIRLGINGLGRIGRHILRLALQEENIEVVCINDINPDIKNWVYTINYDTIYGKSNFNFKIEEDFLKLRKNKIKTYHQELINKIPWEDWGVDVIADCTGVNKNVINARELISNQSVKKILISHSPENVDFTMILGVNENNYDNSHHNIIASSICDATAISPVTKIIDDHLKIKSGYVTTLHPWLNYQNLMDGPSTSWSVPGEVYHHYALGRSAIGNMIPKPPSAMDAVFKVLPNLNRSKIGSFSYRTPTEIIASADITYFVEEDSTKTSILNLLKNYINCQKYPVIKITDQPLVSLDYVGEEYSAIIDTRWIDIIDKKLVKLVLWYDNEFGYASNLIRQIKYIGKYI